MRRTTNLLLATAAVLALAGIGRGAPAPAPAPAPASAYTPEQARMLAIRAAQVDGVNRLTEIVLATPLAGTTTVGQALGPGSDKEMALRVFLRSARVVGEPRAYSDGVAEVDVEVPVEVVAHEIAALHAPAEGGTVDLGDLARAAIDGCIRTSGSGRAPRNVPPEVLKRLESAGPDELPEMFPAGWAGVTATGRVGAIREARVRAYEAMAAYLKGLYLGSAEKVADLVEGQSAAEAAFEAFVRSLPVQGDPRMMPDRIAEVDVVADLADLIRVLKDILRLRPESRLTEERIDRLSIRLKMPRLSTTGRGMPPTAEIRPVETAPVAGGAPLPDWAAETLGASAEAEFSPDADDPQQARVLAARSAKVRALADLERQVDAVTLAANLTVRQRAAKDEVFRRDLKTFLSGARTVASVPREGGKGWQVTLRLPLLRLYELSLPR